MEFVPDTYGAGAVAADSVDMVAFVGVELKRRGDATRLENSPIKENPITILRIGSMMCDGDSTVNIREKKTFDF